MVYFLIDNSGLRVCDLRLRVCDLNSRQINTEPKMKILRKIKKCPHHSKQRNSPRLKIGLFFIVNKEKTEPISSISSVSLEWLRGVDLNQLTFRLWA